MQARDSMSAAELQVNGPMGCRWAGARSNPARASRGFCCRQAHRPTRTRAERCLILICRRGGRVCARSSAQRTEVEMASGRIPGTMAGRRGDVNDGRCGGHSGGSGCGLAAPAQWAAGSMNLPTAIARERA